MTNDSQAPAVDGAEDTDAAPASAPAAVPGVPQIYAALDYLNRETRALAKNQRNKDQKYDFRGIDDLYNAMHPLLAAASVVTIPGEILEIRSEQRVSRNGGPMNWVLVRRQYRILSLVDGSEVIAEGVGEAVDVGDKGMNKAQTNAHKYLFFQLFTIPTSEPESDHSQPEASGRYQPQAPRWDDPQPQPQSQAPRWDDPAPTAPHGSQTRLSGAPAPQEESVPALNLETLTTDLMNATTLEQVTGYQRLLVANMRARRIDNQAGTSAMKLIRARKADFDNQE